MTTTAARVAMRNRLYEAYASQREGSGNGQATVAARRPDLALLAQAYSATGDADEFVTGIFMGQLRPVGMLSRIKAALIGPRHHLWMYDGRSLSKLVTDAGFTDVTIMPPGKTNIPKPGGLDLEERAGESVYVEATAPGVVSATLGAGRQDGLLPA